MRSNLLRSASVALLTSVAGCASSYGAEFDFPSAPPVPPGTTVVVEDTGEDGDDPIRFQIQVIDAESSKVPELLEFYQTSYPASDGWKLQSEPWGELCLVNRTHDDYVQVVDVLAYTGTRVPVAPGRHLVMVTRDSSINGEPCGGALTWTAPDLYE